MLNKLANIIKDNNIELSFTLLEIGGVPLGGEEEPFYKLLDLFPTSKVIAFEVDKDLCEKLNKTQNRNVVFYPAALGDKEETRPFYETNHAMCCSLYQPNDELNKLFNNLEVAYLNKTSIIDTVSLDYFVKSNDITDVDFVKIDIQGAELDVFKGGLKALQNTLLIVSEVEFIPIYINQPLFGDVSKFLDSNGFMFHKFLGLAGRSMAPIVVEGNPNFPIQHMWSDAVFIRHISEVSKLESIKILKLSILALIYGSPDLSYYCLNLFDKIKNTNFKQVILEV